MSKCYIFDSSALLAIIFNEPGMGDVNQYLSNSIMSTVNFTETITKLMNKGIARSESVVLTQSLISKTMDFTLEQSYFANEIDEQNATNQLKLSLAGRACLALAKETGFPVLTADITWDKLNLGIKIKQIK